MTTAPSTLRIKPNQVFFCLTSVPVYLRSQDDMLQTMDLRFIRCRGMLLWSILRSHIDAINIFDASGLPTGSTSSSSTICTTQVSSSPRDFRRFQTCHMPMKTIETHYQPIRLASSLETWDHSLRVVTGIHIHTDHQAKLDHTTTFNANRSAGA
ncbi:predicted protein [Lichtheimia corymbifera JMRC:FSU:9682]|uniref:Uncharacterized protein n=1 Tax=Lichtheimia corymbifera JMRC:FSU:9682 TaxID=1263082 RepID=A0A068SBM1_9FUNG|nr:predicted protein [Lichtheimia corymbifera JMRC:FSU:9682]